MANDSLQRTLTTFLGLDNRHSPAALVSWDKGRGATFLPESVNIDLTAEQTLAVRTGYTLASAGVWHSIWTSPSGVSFGVKGGRLVAIAPETLAATDLLGLSSRFVSFADTSAEIYFTDENVFGVITDTTTATLLTQIGEYSDSPLDTTTSSTQYDSLPPGRCLAWGFGRLWVGAEAVYYSNPHLPRVANLDENFLDLPDVVAILPVVGGIYFGTLTDVWFLGGGNPAKVSAEFKQVSTVGVVPRTGRVLPGEKFKLENVTEPVAVWDTILGKMIGLPGGQVFQPHADKISVAPASYGAPLLREYNGQVQHITSLAKTGDVENARFGDVAVAEVRRNGIVI